MEVDQLRALLRPMLDGGGSGATDESIREAESRIGRFAADYRRFVAEFGWAEFGQYEVYGLGEHIPRYLNVVEMTLSERRESGIPLRAGLICVMNDGGGNFYCFDSKSVQAADHDTPIVIWDHELGLDQDPEWTSPSFTRWLAELLEV